jgi:hypothetical protein
MRQETSVSDQAPVVEAAASIRLRGEHFDFVTQMLGHVSEDEKAAFIGMTYRQLRRARKGEVVGERFVAGTLTALAGHRDQFAAAGVPITFESLFEATPASAAGCRS